MGMCMGDAFVEVRRQLVGIRLSLQPSASWGQNSDRGAGREYIDLSSYLTDPGTTLRRKVLVICDSFSSVPIVSLH